ncbi:exodeoxyribonuclease V subunit alpha [Craterilacuibacter sp. RT1T]|uniref:exodeoxyribonuclease V subunit alpha n=1 Tax=Craterilacuibacter sp. RT1T TaxID=2942211 RepID=UPI0020BEC3D1|nr:exodeoxyribonuclease V subunit alpha [Craterilacuibacter sp. RT1T]MCL6264272.1 exodeoxyribonuclease V subunit alpha [Craterilacuibacter sp. RT1T]
MPSLNHEERSDDVLPGVLSGLMRRLDPGLGEAASAAIDALVRANRAGHVCRRVLDGESRRELMASSLVARAGAYAPLVLDEGERLYFARHWWFEKELAARLAALAAHKSEVDPARVRALLDALFAPTDEGAADRQRLAAALAVRQHLLVISGGPGTGKTTTVVRLLAMLAALSPRPLVMGMAAPTGKAAARLSESMRGARAALDVAPEVKVQLPDEAQTLHRLIALVPGRDAPRYHAGNPLPLDVLVIDEASMVDLTLMHDTVAALPGHARLILLGDRDQLASVDPGAVLGDVAAREAWCASTLAWLAKAGLAAPGEAGEAQSLSDAVVFLTRSHRFGEKSGIGRLARAVNSGNEAAVLALLADSAYPDIEWQAHIAPDEEAHYRERAAYFALAHGGAAPAEVFAEFLRFMLLTGEKREVARLNQAVEAFLLRDSKREAESEWYVGRAVMVRENDYSVGLFNGDIGIALADGDSLRVYFPRADGSFRAVAPARLPGHETAFAMTVHKSQGSEFDRVWLVLPQQSSALFSRALLYTGITRARLQCRLIGPQAVLLAATSRVAERESGLGARLWRD